MSTTPPPTVWGSSFWRFLHYFSMNSPDRAYIKQLKDFIPCEQCRSEWRDPADTEDLAIWSMNLHNHINSKMGKYAQWDMTDFHIAHKNICDVCEQKEYMYMFPWNFIHTVALHPESLEFLKTFNATYPCISCRSEFFTDEPMQDESIHDWSIRHHKRWNAEKGLPPYVPPEVRIQQPESCDGCSSIENHTIQQP